MSDGTAQRTVFFVSDGTGITAETLGHSVLARFDAVTSQQVRVPFVTDEAAMRAVVARIDAVAERDGVRPIVFATLVNPSLTALVSTAKALVLDLFQPFVTPVEAELGRRAGSNVGGFHTMADAERYTRRIEAINFSLAHDDGQSSTGLAEADVILVGVSRCGKTPTSLYLAMQYGVKAANYPLIPEDFERDALPEALPPFRGKLFGLTIQPERLAQVRHERRPNSRYASLENCRREVREAERLMQREGIAWLSTTTKSIEELAATIMTEVKLDRRGF
ncbi:MAG: kinase/pyrophosphorylase [Myxococcaceae bacterium]|jgi:regulator of PEP synthase PpsR (kinase-PPPase family)|nr:kinase/pyrophosphorylase [Myxococcaceae bacterium]MCA3012111.1 kinase/pyrophosphorylase [Myxococcaceae bacterium]